MASKAAGVLKPGVGNGETYRLNEEQLQRLARVVHIGLDLLIVAYAKAESMDPNPEEKYGDLRTQWGMFLYNYIINLPENA